MSSIPVQFDDLLKVVKQLTGEQKRILREYLDEESIETDNTAQKPRVLGLHAGMIWTSDDFDDPLPDEFCRMIPSRFSIT